MENADTATGAIAGAAASDEEEPKRMAIICWSNDLDRVWPVMILATTGAASGLEVDVFFTFWGYGCCRRTTSGSLARTGCKKESRCSTAAAVSTSS